MGFGTNPLQNQNHEDKSQYAITGRPQQNDVHSIYVKGSQPWWRRWWATRDMFQEHHWEVLTCAKYAYKGALTAILVGATYQFKQLSVNALAINKGRVFGSKNGFTGPALLALRQASRHGALGAFFGVTYFFWFYQLVCSRGHEHTFNRYVYGHVAYGAALAAFFSIRRTGAGALLGGIIGWIYYNTAHGNLQIGNTAEEGINFEFKGLTPEQREAIRQRDLISHLSRTPEFKLNLFNKV
ncbi:unnamed protein product [Paramecium octaurelia]|uniref:Transmembrane protein n=1 Tax=Paramecium octaurelia TaxID=43137 RepID=A0A8S1THZ5_PAROT|nr:unnamed protein product [Paramecium octaurelia]